MDVRNLPQTLKTERKGGENKAYFKFGFLKIFIGGILLYGN